MDRYEKAARALGWVRDGDCGGIIYNVNDYESWKAAVSWAPDNGSIYESWEDCCEQEGIELNLPQHDSHVDSWAHYVLGGFFNLPRR